MATPPRAQPQLFPNAQLVFCALVIICLMAAVGLAYSIYPYIVIGQMTLYDAAAAAGSLQIVFWGVAVTLPLIAAYSVFVYRVFGGKATDLRYD
ncbi:MAG: cytochrome d ubiquinol oxidase subunit II [Pseudomonadota bacterium]